MYEVLSINPVKPERIECDETNDDIIFKSTCDIFSNGAYHPCQIGSYFALMQVRMARFEWPDASHPR